MIAVPRRRAKSPLPAAQRAGRMSRPETAGHRGEIAPQALSGRRSAKPSRQRTSRKRACWQRAAPRRKSTLPATPCPSQRNALPATPRPSQQNALPATLHFSRRSALLAMLRSSRHGTSELATPRPSRHTQPAQQREQRMFHVKHSPLNRLNNARCQRRAIGRQRKTTPPPRIAPRRGRQARQAQSRKRTRRKQQARCHTHETRTDQETAHERRTRHASAPQRPALVFHVKHQLPIRRNVVSSDEKEPWRSPDSPLCARASSHSGLRTARNCSRS